MRDTQRHIVRTIEDDGTPLLEAIRAGLDRPLLLWAHPQIGQSALVQMATEEAGLPFRSIEAEVIESWDGMRDLTNSGHFRELSLEKFLARGERADPETFALAPNAVLYLRGLNRLPGRIMEAVFEQMVNERKILNNPLPEGARVIAAAIPHDRALATELLGPVLHRTWKALEAHTSLRYDVSPVPRAVQAACEQWAVHPSVPRFIAWGRRCKLAAEVTGYLEEEHARDPERATTELHASLVRESELFPELASPRAFSDLGALLAERRPYFSSREVKEAVRRSTTRAELETWLGRQATTWDPEAWIEGDRHLTVRGEPVTGSVWLRHFIDEVRRGEARVDPAELPAYAAYERRSLEMWATQELGDEIGGRFVAATTITAADLAHLG